jgi:hypothetical protein
MYATKARALAARTINRASRQKMPAARTAVLSQLRDGRLRVLFGLRRAPNLIGPEATTVSQGPVSKRNKPYLMRRIAAIGFIMLKIFVPNLEPTYYDGVGVRAPSFGS